jgi:flagellar biosynthesis GTPase FlhF
MKIAFVGPRGGGKSSVMAKTAAQLTTRLGLSTRLVSLEHQTKSEDEPILSPDDDKNSVLLIDTPPIDRNRDPQMKMPERLNMMGVNQLFFVFSACSRTSDLINEADLFRLYAPTFMIATHLDETSRWGGIISMTDYMDSQLAFVTDTPGDSGELIAPNAHTLAAALLKREVPR